MIFIIKNPEYNENYIPDLICFIMKETIDVFLFFQLL